MKKFPLTALETSDCPPHYWEIENLGKGKNGMGVCKKCWEIQDFSDNGNGHKEATQELRRELMRIKSSNGGKNNKGKTRNHYLSFY